MTNKDIEFAQSALRAVRYGVAWEGDPKRPTHKEMPDGYWVPWHVAYLLLDGLKSDDKPNFYQSGMTALNLYTNTIERENKN